MLSAHDEIVHNHDARDRTEQARVADEPVRIQAVDADVRLEPAQALEQFPVISAMPMKPVSRTPLVRLMSLGARF